MGMVSTSLVEGSASLHATGIVVMPQKVRGAVNLFSKIYDRNQ
jgi:hypothetical protein